MSANIQGNLEKRSESGKWIICDESDVFFNFKSYFIFGWWADVRNYSEIPPLASEWKKVKNPPDYSEYGDYAHVLSAITLLDFDYEQHVTDQRYDPWVTATYREHLGDAYFERLEILRRSKADRLVFTFF